jgi:2-C-methyl-D-erythritol 4-phosphate cytidylyltransferase
MPSNTLSAIIVAAGSGTRLGLTTPKGFVKLGERSLFLYSLDVLLEHSGIHDVIVVAPESHVDEARRIIATIGPDKKVTVVAGGRQRWQSVQSGVLASASEWVLVHDAARPFVTASVIDAVLDKIDIYDCVITAIPETDTIRTRIDALAGEIVDRSKLVRVGTPQLFRRRVLMEAFAQAPRLPSPPTDEAALMQLIGVPVALACGDTTNFKITTPADLAIAEALIAKNK